ncbi:MAG: glycoside hydrolase family 9 protein, partial [Terriglobales bacterium]
IGINHFGFLPGAVKTAVVRGTEPPAEYVIWDVGDWRPVLRGRLQAVASDLGAARIADLSGLRQPGIYQLFLGGGDHESSPERSVPFFIAADVWRRTLPTVAGYYRYQRCGVAVPGVHAACHLDDARRRDTGEHVDTTGGWHDAGDLRKWMDTTMLNAVALLHLRRFLASPRPGDPTSEQLLAEVRHGNSYFLKMQDTDGRVWHDVAGGVNGDNSDNHWTDNVVGTGDDRYLNPEKTEVTAAIFATLEAMAAQEFAASDAAYAARALAASRRAWSGSRRAGSTAAVAWWALAAAELVRATGEAEFHAEGQRLGAELLVRQQAEFAHGQREVRGYWMEGDAPFVDIVNSAAPALALLALYETLPQAPRRAAWLTAVRVYLEDYVRPMAARNAYGLVPTGLYLSALSDETYRPLAGRLLYRYFLPVRKQFWWQGANCHLAAHALLLARYAAVAGLEPGAGQPYRDLAYRQLEWIAGANPFGASQITGLGVRQPYPHSRYVGLIPGGIMNGIAGDAADQPVLDREMRLDWRTCEYWSPHVAYYLWAVAALEPPAL